MSICFQAHDFEPAYDALEKVLRVTRLGGGASTVSRSLNFTDFLLMLSLFQSLFQTYLIKFSLLKLKLSQRQGWCAAGPGE